MLKKLLSAFVFKAEVKVSMEVGLREHASSTPPPETPPPPPIKKKNIELTPKSTPDNLMRLPVAAVKQLDKLSYAEENFVLNVAHYQLGHVKEANLLPAEKALVLYLPEKQLIASYREDTKRWEVFYNSHLWEHENVLTSYEVPREKLKYLSANLCIRRTSYLGVRDIEHLLCLMERDFFSTTGERKHLVHKKFEWTTWKELAAAA